MLPFSPGLADVTRSLTALEHHDYRGDFAQHTPESTPSVGGPEGLASTSLGAAVSSGIAEKYEIVSQSVERDDLDTLASISASQGPPAENSPHQSDRGDLRLSQEADGVIGRMPGEHSCLSFVWAGRAGEALMGRGEKSPAGVRLLQRLRQDLFEPDRVKEVIEKE